CVAGWMLSSVGDGAAAGATHHHEHEAPHGGALIVLGDEFVHLELVLEPKTGSLRAYVLDGAAERGVPVAQRALAVDVVPPRGEPFQVSLAAVGNVLTGEVVGKTSEFAGRSTPLVGLERFEGAIRELAVKGQSFRNVRFRYPEGNENPSDDREEREARSLREEQEHATSEDAVQ
ncbi:MAG: hypothetical protein MJE66_08400, partial [Proteobacteria bacterium]|nr:hypothetical protein [Pseudomonadota bacterium]